MLFISEFHQIKKHMSNTPIRHNIATKDVSTHLKNNVCSVLGEQQRSFGCDPLLGGHLHYCTRPRPIVSLLLIYPSILSSSIQ